jgi:valyl-tRNA synthetase
MEAVQELITQVRRLRKEYGVPEGAQVEAVLSEAPESFQQALASEDASIRRLARVSALSTTSDGEGKSGAHSVLKNGAGLFIPLEGVIDLEKERERLAGEIQRLTGQLRGVQGKLENRQFVERAPEEVVAREREKEASFREQIEKLQEKLEVFQNP